MRVLGRNLGDHMPLEFWGGMKAFTKRTTRPHIWPQDADCIGHYMHEHTRCLAPRPACAARRLTPQLFTRWVYLICKMTAGLLAREIGPMQDNPKASPPWGDQAFRH